MAEDQVPGRDDPGTGEQPESQYVQHGPELPLPPEFPPPPGGWELWASPATVVLEAPTPRPRRRFVAALVAGLLLLGGIGVGWGITRSVSGGSSPSAAPLTAAQPSGKADQALNVQAVANQVEPAVVDVNTVILANASGRTAQAAGTGMIITSSGQVLTNNHVIQGATKIEVSIDGRSGTYTAQVVGADTKDDIALLQIQGGISGLPTVTLADSSSLQVGQDVVAIGNALGQGGTPTVTQGSIAALGLSIAVSDGRGGTESLSNMIEMDAPIQPGDSGGPLVNAAGQVVGMITAGSRERSEGSSTMGFAITSNMALSIANEIRAGHASSTIIIGQTGFLGVEVQNLDAAAIARLGLNVTSGALVVGVFPGSPAAQAGMPSDSVITGINGVTIVSADTLGPIIHQYKPGDQIKVTWVDRRGTHTSSILLVTGPAV